MSRYSRFFGRFYVLALILGGGFSVLANPAIKLNGAWRHEPWDGQVDISYTISQIEPDDAGFYETAIFYINGAKKTRCLTFVNEDGLHSHNGTFIATWDAATDIGPDFDYRNIQLTGRMICGAEYLIVDISSGPTSDNYPLSYKSAEQVDAAGGPAVVFNTDEYKSDKVVFRKCHAGRFFMGTDAKVLATDDPVTDTLMKPRHEVQLTRDFYAALFLTTQKQFNNMASAVWTSAGVESAYVFEVETDKSKNPLPRSLYCPAYGIGKATSLRVAEKIYARTGVEFTLLTDAQWEYACRAGTTTPLYNGDYTNENMAKIALTSDTKTLVQTAGVTIYGCGMMEVGSLAANNWGFFDMLGNATEWVLDYTYAYTTNVAVDPYYPIDATNTSTPRRGGSYKMGNQYATCAYRDAHGNDCTAEYHGFRLAYPFPDATLGVSETFQLGASICASEDIAIKNSYEDVDPATIELIRVRQRYPWNELVDVDYRLTGYAMERRLAMTVVDNVHGTRYVAKNFLVDPMSAPEQYLAGGVHRITWCSTNDGCVVFSRNCTTSLGLYKGGQEGWNTPADAENAYLVVDLATGACVEETQSSPQIAYNADVYKTTKIVLRRISAGVARIGAASNDFGDPTTEARHPVKFSNPYYLGLFEVTQAQWRTLLGTDAAAAFAGNDLFPVENVTAAQAAAFASALAAKTGRRFALPTEAQWECAARAGSAAAYPDGSLSGVNLKSFCWYAENAEETTHAVGTRSPNTWSFWDMGGNVAEWCADAYTANLAFELVDPFVSEGTGNVVRGGSWNDATTELRRARRIAGTTASGQVGFRVAVNVQ